MAREKKSDAEQKESQDSESHEKSGTSKRKEVVIEKTIDEGLPSGWIKEIHIKKTGHGTTRRDLFYIDTASGYIFRSRLDVMRFLETGVISKHAYMRKGSGITDVKLRKDEISSPSSAKGEKQVQTRAMKQRFAGEETPENSALKPSTELGESPTARPMSTSADVVINENNPVLKETEPASILVKAPSSKEKPNSGKKLSLPPRSSRRLAGVEAEVVSNSIPIERILRNKRKEHSPSEIDKLTTEKPAEPSVDVPKPVELSVDVQTPVEPSADVQKPNKKTLPETQENDITVKNPVLKRSKKPLDGKIGRCSNGKTQSNKRKPKNGTHLSLPSRSSKRLAGIEAELAVHSTPVERHLCNPSKKSDKFESTRETFAAENPSHFTESQQNGLGIASSGLFEYLNIKNEGSSSKLDRSQDQSLEVRSDPRDSKDAGAEVGLTETRECSRDQPLPQNPIASSETGTREPDHQDPNFCFPSSLWSDPCLEFAYKTLTGAIPLDDNLAIEDYVQHQLRTSTHDNINNGNSNNNNLSLQDIDLNSLFQDDAPSEFDDSNPQFQTTPVSPFTGDFGLPNYNGFRSPKSS